MKRNTEQRYRVQYSEADIPDYFALARQYTLCDHFFSEVAGPSSPSHLMLITADSPVINNPPFSSTPKNLYDLKSFPLALQKAGLTWGNYGGYAFHYIRELAALPGNHTRDLFAHQAAAGQLPSVSWVYGDGNPSFSEHPTENITLGSEWTAQQIQAIVDGGLWPRTVVFVTWDDGVDGMTTLLLPMLRNGTASERSIQRTRSQSLMASSFVTALAFLVL